MTNPQTKAQAGWQRVGMQHHHGIALPLFSLHSEKSGGIGEFLDLIELIHFCKECHFDVIQLLPLNDTGSQISPYSSLSVFALHPIYISLRAFFSDVELFSLQELNREMRVDYRLVWELKKKFLLKLYHRTFPELSKKEEWHHFIDLHRDWLFPYALFKAIKEREDEKAWEMWPKRYRVASEELYEEFKEEISFHLFLQYLAFQQMEEVKRVAEKEGVLIKGDIPILMNRDSADVWKNSSLFHLELSSGAPPDALAKEGQNWGFPVYNWEAIEKEGFQFWKRRIEIASHFFDLYRLDHVVGFFRIWVVPPHKKPSEGHFVPENEDLWLQQGRKVLTMLLETSPLLPIAEDLGTVPPKVREELLALGIPGTKVMRWERRWEGDKGYILPSDYPSISMTTVSTHDTDTLTLWWRHAPKEAELFCKTFGWDYQPFLTPERLLEILNLSHRSNSLFHINLLQEYLALFPELVSPNPLEERINQPGTTLATNWTYKFKPTVEALLAHSALKQKMRDMLLPFKR